MSERQAWIVGSVRTPIGRYGGALSGCRPDDLAALVIAEVLRRSSCPVDEVDEVVFGAANQAGEDNRNVARMAALLAGLPDSVAGMTVNRLCASGLTALATAAQMVRAGEADVVVAGGVESMTRAPWVVAKPDRPWSKPGELADTSLGWRFVNPRMRLIDEGRATIGLGETAEEVAALDGISREDCDELALRSHRRAVAARDRGDFVPEIVPVDLPGGTVVEDEAPRPDTSAEKLAKLRPVFRPGGVVTAGNASPLNDGAAAVVVASDSALARLQLVPQARVVGSASAGVAPSLMGLGPVPATEKLFRRTSTTVGQLDAIELNEAFAAQVVACVRRLEIDPELVNADGGAIALGHPLGCSGTRLVVSLLGRLARGGGRLGLATMCVGVGQGVSLLVERA